MKVKTVVIAGICITTAFIGGYKLHEHLIFRVFDKFKSETLEAIDSEFHERV